MTHKPHKALARVQGIREPFDAKKYLCPQWKSKQRRLDKIRAPVALPTELRGEETGASRT